MGAALSTSQTSDARTRRSTEEEVMDEKRAISSGAVEQLRSMTGRYQPGSTKATALIRASSSSSSRAGIQLDSLSKWESSLLADPKNRMAQLALSKMDMSSVLFRREASIRDLHIFNTKIHLEGLPVTNQKQSGRCWLFAACNVIRVAMMKKYHLKEFELSQSYLFFYDHVEKANYYLESMIDLAHEPIDSRIVAFISSAPVQDGGQWDMAVNLIERYGLVPKTVYPESFNSSASSKVDKVITLKLREYALELREMAIKSASLSSIRTRKNEMVESIYGILVIACGTPPKPDEKFTWSYYDEKSNYAEVKDVTPLEFYRTCSSFNASEHYSLIHDPRNDRNKLYTVARLGNVVGGRPIQYINTEIEMLKKCAIACLKKDIPVWFGCDVGASSDSATGIMDADLYDYHLGFNISLSMNKIERIKTGSSALTHAMVLTGVHLEKPSHASSSSSSEESIRWRVENSWSSDTGKDGFMVMTDKFFDEFVFQVVIHQSFIPKELLKVLDTEPISLEAWDPLGALA